jgi:hypothetical protein
MLSVNCPLKKLEEIEFPCGSVMEGVELIVTTVPLRVVKDKPYCPVAVPVMSLPSVVVSVKLVMQPVPVPHSVVSPAGNGCTVPSPVTTYQFE